MRKSTTALYLVVLSFSDLMILYTGLLRQWINIIAEVDIRNVSIFTCKLHTSLVYLFSDFSSWLLVSVTLERVAGVCWPTRGKAACTKKVAAVVVLVMFACLLLLNSHFLYGRGDKILTIDNVTVVEKCVPLFDEYERFWSNAWPWIDLCFFCLIPFFVLLIGNACIIIKVTSSRRAVRRQVGPIGASSSSSSKMSSMTAMLLLVNLVFFLCTLPVSVFLIGIHKWTEDMTAKKNAVLSLVYATVNILMYLNNAVNFLLYCISGPRFRRELKALFGASKTDDFTNGQISKTFQTKQTRRTITVETVA